MAHVARARTPIQIQGQLGLPVLPGPTQGGMYQGGMRNLLDLINNPGKTDSRMLNADLAQAGNQTQQQSASLLARMARSGLGNSGVGMAVGQAVRGAGGRRAGALMTEEARRREALRRSDTNLIDQYIQQPSLAIYGADRGVALGMNQMNQQNKSENIAAASALAGNLASAFKKNPQA